MSFGARVPPPPPLPKPPDPKDWANAFQKEQRRRSRYQGRESTLLGGSTAGTEPFVKTLLGQP